MWNEIFFFFDLLYELIKIPSDINKYEFKVNEINILILLGHLIARLLNKKRNIFTARSTESAYSEVYSINIHFSFFLYLLL